MMKVKKLIATLLVVVMSCGILAGCGQKEDEVVEGGKLTVGIPQKVSVSDYDDNAYTEYIEENTGIEIEFMFFSSKTQEYKQQFALMASSNEEFPDVLIGFDGIGTRTINEYGEDGYFIDLTDLIDKYADNYKAQYEALDDEKKILVDRAMTSIEDGNIYGMPKVKQIIIDNMQSLCFINQSWLDAVGMSAPTNVEELYNVLNAFKTQDPNGNGKADEIPMLGGQMMYNYIINAYMCYEQSHPYNVDEQGKVYAPYTTDEFREALSFMNKMCEEGLYSDLSFTVTAKAELKNLYTPSEGAATVGVICGHPSNYMDTSNPITDEYVALAPLADATGEGGYIVVSKDIAKLAGFITKDCERPELAMKFIDFFFADETVTRGRHGEKGVDWQTGSGEDIYGNDIEIELINDQAFFEGNATWCSDILGIQTPKNYNGYATAGNQSGDRVSTLLAGSYKTMVEYPLNESTVRGLNYTNKEDEIKEQYESTLHEYVKEQISLFIMGSVDPDNDADWNTYLKQIDELSVSQLIKIRQSAYDRALKE